MNEQTVNQFGCKKIAAERNQCCFPRFLCPRFSDGMIWYQTHHLIRANNMYMVELERWGAVYKKHTNFSRTIALNSNQFVEQWNDQAQKHVYRLIDTLFIKCHTFFTEVSSLWQWFIDIRVLDAEKSIRQSTVKRRFITHPSTWK